MWKIKRFAQIYVSINCYGLWAIGLYAMRGWTWVIATSFHKNFISLHSEADSNEIESRVTPYTNDDSLWDALITNKNIRLVPQPHRPLHRHNCAVYDILDIASHTYTQRTRNVFQSIERQNEGVHQHIDTEFSILERMFFGWNEVFVVGVYGQVHAHTRTRTLKHDQHFVLGSE